MKGKNNMKKLCIIMALSMLSVTACSQTVSKEEYESVVAEKEALESEKNLVSSSTETSTIPEVTTNTTPDSSSEDTTVIPFSEIKSGKYNNQQVYIKCVLDNVIPDSLNDGIKFDAWIYDNNDTFSPELNCTVWTKDVLDGKELIQSATTGTTLIFKLGVYKDGSIAFSDINKVLSVEDSYDLSNIKSQYKNDCKNLEISELLRNPNNYKYNNLKYSGKILQVIEQDPNSSATKFLLDTGKENGIIQVVYNRHENEPQFIEDDNVTVYGQFYLLDQYISTLGTNQTVPRIGGIIIDR